MPTSAARISEGARRRLASEKGFTLLEITLVVVILALVVTVVVPRLGDTGRAELKAQVRRLVMTFRILRSEAILHGTPFRLNFDLDQGRYWVTAGDGGSHTDKELGTLGPLARGSTFKDPVQFSNVEFPQMGAKVAQGQIYTMFYPDGSIDLTIIRLATFQDMYTLYVNPMHYRLETAEGDRDIQY